MGGVKPMMHATGMAGSKAGGCDLEHVLARRVWPARLVERGQAESLWRS